MVHAQVDLVFVVYVMIKEMSFKVHVSDNYFRKILGFSVLATCGSQVNDNCSYIVQSSFSSLSLTSGITNPCTYTVCPVGNNICRIRYDFTVI